MALIDVKEYYYKMLEQYLEMKDDLADFEQAVKDGHITEDQLVLVKEDFAAVEQNYQRLTYIMYLFELPKRKRKKIKFKKNKSNSLIETYMRANHADTAAVIDENTSMIAHLRAELEHLVETDKANS